MTFQVKTLEQVNTDKVKRLVDKSLLDLDELSDWQKAAVVLLSTKGEHKMGYEKMAKELGVNYVTLYRFRQRPDVKKYILDYTMARIVDRIPEVLEAQVEQAISRKSVKSAELLLKYAGLLIERREIESSVTTTSSESQKDNKALQDELDMLRNRLKRNEVEAIDIEGGTIE